jgi:hypothetical protein
MMQELPSPLAMVGIIVMALVWISIPASSLFIGYQAYLLIIQHTITWKVYLYSALAIFQAVMFFKSIMFVIANMPMD